MEQVGLRLKKPNKIVFYQFLKVCQVLIMLKLKGHFTESNKGVFSHYKKGDIAPIYVKVFS